MLDCLERSAEAEQHMGPRLGLEGSYSGASVVDQTEAREVWLAALLVGLVFTFLAASTLYIRGNGQLF